MKNQTTYILLALAAVGIYFYMKNKKEDKPIAPGIKPTPDSPGSKPEGPGGALPQGASPSTQYDAAGNYNPNAGHENDSNYNNTPYSGQDDAGNNVPSGPQAGMGIVTIY